MPIDSVSIHPAIGIARVGDSPDQFFIGPERPGEKPNPEDGFKDEECRVKRQAARFRVFATHDDGTVEELTDEDADIEWSVHLANKKATTRSRNAGSPLGDAEHTIDPGAESVDGPNERATFDSGQITFQGAPAPETVPLGEIRSDTQGRLLVLGGRGNSGSPTGRGLTRDPFDNPEWYDDVSDGPVTAKVVLPGGETFEEDEVDGAWVVVAPPKFAPELDSVITLYDRLYQLMRDEGYVTPPSTPSYTDDIHPIIERAIQSDWVSPVSGVSQHGGALPTGGSWSQPIYDASARQQIFNKLKDPSGGGGGNMPLLKDLGKDIDHLTETQHEMMRKWKDDDFSRDWSGPPETPGEVTPEGMDEAALENCVGAAFYLGIEVGGDQGQRPIIEPSNYSGPFRLDHSALEPGDVTKYLALPWQHDFKACGDYWWPVPRPNEVYPQDGSGKENWDRNITDAAAMVNSWSDLGFVVEQEGRYEEVGECETPFISLLTPAIEFRDVPQGPMGTARTTRRAIEFEVRSTGDPVTLQVDQPPSHPRIDVPDPSDQVGPTSGNEVATARIWVTYTTGSPTESLANTVVVENPATGETWTVSVTASTVGRKTAATALVLDRSGSMDEDRGDGETKHRSLQKAASIFVDAMLEGDGVAVVRYNQDAQELQGVEKVGPAGGMGTVRNDTRNVIEGPMLDPGGATSIGDGISTGRQSLTAPGTGDFDVESLVVLTDGKENRPDYIADVAGDIDEQTYSVGLGTPENTSAPALQTISGNHGGYLLMTGEIGPDDEFILQKYFVQILAGISNAEVVLDPEGELRPGAEHRIPFHMTDADSGVDVFLLTEQPYEVDFRLQTPNGNVIEPWRARTDPTMRWVLSDDVVYYRLSLPAVVRPGRLEGEGRWHALLELGDPRLEPDESEWHEYQEFRDRIDAAAEPEVSPQRFRRREQKVDTAGREGQITNLAARRSPGLAAASSPRGGLRYSLVVHSYSDLSLEARVQQSGWEPGAELRLDATITESDAPVEEVSVRTDVTRPDGSSTSVGLEEVGDGRFEGTVGTTRAGVYRFRVRARGRTRHGLPFQREQRLTAAVWHGGDRDAETAGKPARERDRGRRICELVDCLLRSDGGIGDELEKRTGVDPDELRACLRDFCPEPVETEAHDGTEAPSFPPELLNEMARLLSRFDLET